MFAKEYCYDDMIADEQTVEYTRRESLLSENILWNFHWIGMKFAATTPSAASLQQVEHPSIYMMLVDRGKQRRHVNQNSRRSPPPSLMISRTMGRREFFSIGNTPHITTV